jgi:hypothetical protein
MHAKIAELMNVRSPTSLSAITPPDSLDKYRSGVTPRGCVRRMSPNGRSQRVPNEKGPPTANERSQRASRCGQCHWHWNRKRESGNPETVTFPAHEWHHNGEFGWNSDARCLTWGTPFSWKHLISGSHSSKRSMSRT